MSNNQTPNFGQNNGTPFTEKVKPIRPARKVPVFRIALGLLVILLLVTANMFHLYS
jgi:hypothetical protein